MSDQPTPLETALDLVVYIPVGLALTVGEEIPKLAAKGRARLGGHVAAARMVGQFAVMQGRREVDRRVGGTKPAPARSAPRPDPAAAPPKPPRPTGTATDAAPPASPRPTGTATDAVGPPRSSPRRAATGPGTAPDVTTLAIPGYASLSASQVVQRLAGLSGDELEAVRRFEAASRGRRTILARVSQLQSR